MTPKARLPKSEIMKLKPKADREKVTKRECKSERNTQTETRERGTEKTTDRRTDA